MTETQVSAPQDPPVIDEKGVASLLEGLDYRERVNKLSILFRALDGQDVSGDDKIAQLTNPRNILERSRYPTYIQLSLAVYLKLLYNMTRIKIYDLWADKLSEALISYKGQGRGEYVEMVKAPQAQQQVFGLGSSTPPYSPQGQPIQAKAHWWSRAPKNKESVEETIE
jgi:hypothetical protein